MAVLCQLINDVVAWTRMLSASAAQIVRINNNCGGTCGRPYVTAAMNVAARRTSATRAPLCEAAYTDEFNKRHVDLESSLQ